MYQKQEAVSFKIPRIFALLSGLSYKLIIDYKYPATYRTYKYTCGGEQNNIPFLYLSSYLVPGFVPSFMQNNSILLKILAIRVPYLLNIYNSISK